MLGIGLASLLVHARGSAQTRPESTTPVRPVHLVYTRAPDAEDCPDAESIRQAVRSRLGYEPFYDPAPATLAARITRERGKLVARIELSGPGESGHQEIAGAADCAGLASAVIVAIALAIDPLAHERSEESTGAVSPERTAPAQEQPARPAPTTPAIARPPEQPRRPSPRTSPRVRTTGGVAINLGSQPGAAFGTALGLELAWRRFTTGLEWQSFLPTAVASESGARARASMTRGVLVACGTIGSLEPCAFVSAGAVRGTGAEGTANARSDVTWYRSVGARAATRLPLGSGVSVRLHTDLEVPLVETRLVVGTSPLFDTSVIVWGFGGSVCVDLL